MDTKGITDEDGEVKKVLIFNEIIQIKETIFKIVKKVLTKKGNSSIFSIWQNLPNDRLRQYEAKTWTGTFVLD